MQVHMNTWDVQNNAQCKIMKMQILQGARLCKMQNYARYKMMQDAKSCKVQSYGPKLCKVQDNAQCKIMQSVELWW